MSFVLWYELIYGNQLILARHLALVPYLVILLPVLDIIGIYFSVRSMRHNESSIGTYMGIIGIIALIVMLYMIITLFGWSQTTG